MICALVFFFNEIRHFTHLVKCILANLADQSVKTVTDVSVGFFFYTFTGSPSVI